MVTSNAQPEALTSQTERSTKLGYVLQGVVEKLLLERRPSGMEITANAEYKTGIIRPDILVGPMDRPQFSIHVTCSDNRDSFRMKRWRYVCELFQLKRHYKAVVSTNVVFGDISLYQPGDLKFLERLFDKTLDLSANASGKKIFKIALKGTDAGEQVTSIVDRIMASLAPHEAAEVIDPVVRILRSKSATTRDIWHLPVVPRVGRTRIHIGIESNFRAAFLRGLLLDDIAYSQLRSFVGGSAPTPPMSAVAVGLISFQEDIDGDHYELSNGAAEACSESLSRLREIILGHANLRTLILEARDEDENLAWLPSAFSEITGRPSLAAVERIIALAANHPRELFLDCLVAAFGKSVNSLEGLWDHSHVPTVKNPLANVVSRTGFVQLTLKQLARNLLSIWTALIATEGQPAVNLASFRAALVRYRRYCLLKGSIVNPLDLMTSDLIEALGYESSKKRRFVSSRVQGSPISTEFLHTFVNRVSGRRFAVKNLYGDTGADHKAEEMAGRLFLIDYDIRDDVALKDESSTGWDFIFLPEGYWSTGQMDLLVSAGWKVADPKLLGSCLADFVGEPTARTPLRRGRRIPVI